MSEPKLIAEVNLQIFDPATPPKPYNSVILAPSGIRGYYCDSTDSYMDEDEGHPVMRVKGWAYPPDMAIPEEEPEEDDEDDCTDCCKELIVPAAVFWRQEVHRKRESQEEER